MSSVSPGAPGERVDELEKLTSDLQGVLNRLSSFQKATLSLRNSQTIEETLDSMESLLEDIVEFTFMRLYLFTDIAGRERDLVRELCPEEFETPWEYVDWAVEKGDFSFIPLTEEGAAESEDLHSLLILPLVGHSRISGVLLLWSEFDSNTFTPEHSTLLNMLGRETASVIEQLRLRRRVESARNELADVVETLPLGIVAVDQDERITILNGTSEFIFRKSRSEALGRPLGELFSPQSYQRLRAAMHGEDAGSAGELELILNDEVQEPFGVTVAPVRLGAAESNGLEGDEETRSEPTGFVIVCRDLKLSQEVARLRELDAMKNDFLSLVSHELRTPLTSIMAYSETLLMEGIIDTEEERREYLEVIHSEGERLSRLINDVLDLTKMEAGKLDYTFQELSIASVIHTSMNAVSSLASQKSMEMPLEIPDDLPPVRADSDRLIQVLTNLYGNAIKFTEEGGTVSTRVRLVEAAEAGEGRMVEVEVEDTGIGIKQIGRAHV